ncbi:hypothetical protein Tco_1073295 [Tanacetum coccineum]
MKRYVRTDEGEFTFLFHHCRTLYNQSLSKRSRVMSAEFKGLVLEHLSAYIGGVAFHSTNVFSTIGNGGVEAKGPRLKVEHTSVASNNTVTQGLSNAPEEHARCADAGVKKAEMGAFGC